MLSNMECFLSVTAASQSEPLSFAERSTDVCKQKRRCGEILDETFKFIQSKTFLDTWLFKENSIYFVMYLPKGK